MKEQYLINLEKIGDGKLGQLWQGDYIKGRSTVVPVLVRKLRSDTPSIILSEFRQEMNLLRGLRHKNFQPVACVSTMSEIPFIAFECQHRQDLKEYVKVYNNTDLQTILNYTYQILSGLEYLHSSKVLVKDLAARNCFISVDNVVQISKCGLGMYRYPDDYKYLPVLGLSPVRWLAPETLQTGIYRQATDIYMAAVLMWEIFSHGTQPYEEYSEDEIVSRILNGEQLHRPKGCPVHIWHVITTCWNNSMEYRLPAIKLKEQFKSFINDFKNNEVS